MDYGLNGSPEGFPVFVVFNDREVLGVFVSKEKAEDCAMKNLSFDKPVTIQPCFVEDIRNITYEII